MQPNQDRDPVAEMLAAEESGEFTYVPPAPVNDDDTGTPVVNTSGVSDEQAPLSPETDHVSRKMVQT